MSQNVSFNEPLPGVRRILIFGDIGRQYAVERRAGAALAAAELRGEEVGTGRAVEYLRPADTGTDRITVVAETGEELSSITLSERMETWNGIMPYPGFTALLSRVDLPGNARIDLETFSPLMMIRSHPGPEGEAHEVLACTRLREVGALFVRVARLTLDEGTDLGQLVLHASEAAGRLHEFVGNDFQLYTRFEPETEIELKIGLKGRASPWGIASSLAQGVRRGDFTGFIPDVGNEHQRWQSAQVTFEVTGAAEDAGYIAFISLPPNTYLVKRKRFEHDGLRREESVELGVEIPRDDFPAFLKEKYPTLSTRPLPFFTRAKFDVNVESTSTGHFFGIEIDEVTVPEHHSTLRQIEIEYHRSRVHDGLDASTIDGEIERLACLVERHLRELGVSGERTFYSKLSYLRELVEESQASSS